MMTNKLKANTSGFRASLSGTSLFDLIQLECNRQANGAVLIRSNLRVGRLFFAGGQILHAVCDQLVGEPALFEILSWDGGEVFPVKTPRSAAHTIHRSWQDLLMEAACAEDEAKRDSEPPRAGAEVLALHPNRESAVGLRFDAGMDERMEVDLDEPIELTMAAADDAFRGRAVATDYAVESEDGALRAQHGNADWMQQTGSYVTRLAELIASALALEGFEQLDASIGSHRLVVAHTPRGLSTVRGDVEHTREELLQGLS